jgi:hypothetical protein
MNQPIDICPDGSLEGLFSILDRAYRNGIMPGLLRPAPDGTPPADEIGRAHV